MKILLYFWEQCGLIILMGVLVIAPPYASRKCVPSKESTSIQPFKFICVVVAAFFVQSLVFCT